jgi:hypothetical protein
VSFRSFKTFVETKDIFGFERDHGLLVVNKVVDEKPIEPLDYGIIVNELCKMPVGGKQAKRLWNDAVSWGTGDTGTLAVVVSPLGSYKAVIRRKIYDLVGEAQWICKKIMPYIDTDKGVGPSELEWVQHLHEQLVISDGQLVEMPSRDWAGLEKLVIELACRIRAEAPPIFVYEGISQVDPTNYIIFMSLRGQGVEAPGQRRINEFHVNVSYKPLTGLIRCFGNEISSPVKGHTWEPQPSEWDEIFAPAQPRKEIEEAILSALSVY